MTNNMNADTPVKDSGDEINLVDLWRILVKHKVIVLVIPVLSLLFGLGYWVYTPPVFESRAVIQIGQIEQVHIEKPDVLVHRLNEIYNLNYGEQGMPRLVQIGIEKRGPANAIVFLAQDHTAAGAQKYLHKIMQDLLADHAKLYKQSMDIQRQRLHSLAQKNSLLNELIQKLPDLDENTSQQNRAQALTAAIEKGKLLVSAVNIENEYTRLHVALGDSQSYPTRFASEPTLSAVPTTPKAKRVFTVALLAGVMAGLFAAFFAEFVARFRLQLREQSPA